MTSNAVHFSSFGNRRTRAPDWLRTAPERVALILIPWQALPPSDLDSQRYASAMPGDICPAKLSGLGWSQLSTQSPTSSLDITGFTTILLIGNPDSAPGNASCRRS